MLKLTAQKACAIAALIVLAPILTSMILMPFFGLELLWFVQFLYLFIALEFYVCIQNFVAQLIF